MNGPRLRAVNKAVAPFDLNRCVGADWKPSNVGLDDVVLDNCCWGAKTVFAGSKDISKQKVVRLVSGRNSLTFSFGVDRITSENPNVIGKMVLDIWNERVSAVRQIFKFVRTVIIEEIPMEKLHIKVKKPELIDKETLLKTVKFDSSWYTVVK